MITTKTEVRKRIEEIGIVPSIRPAGIDSDAGDVRFAAEALQSAGIPIAEITMTVPGALDVITDVARHFPEIIVGADLLDLETARRCVNAGARFLTSPCVVPGL